MWNNLKMDLYRMVRQKSFYISMIIMLLLYFWMSNASGLQSNTPFASFYADRDTMVDFLYYFPKSAFYTIAVLVFLSLFFSEEYSSGFVKNIYPMIHHKELLLLERFLFSFVAAFVYWIAVIILVAVENIWHQDSFAAFELVSFLSYSFMQQGCHDSGSCRLWKYDDVYAAYRYHVIAEGRVYRLYTLCCIRQAAIPMGCTVIQPCCYGGNYKWNPV